MSKAKAQRQAGATLRALLSTGRPFPLARNAEMSQPPPLRPGDRVRYIYDRDHVEIVESCRYIDTAIKHWQVVSRWEGGCRIADAVEFILEDAS
jgi:hypothetical protein